MKKHWNYFKYVCKHKWFVFKAGRKLKVPLWRLIIHDWSKFSRAEWTPYANRFFGGRAGIEDKSLDPDEFRRAWLHHIHRNPHHWDHWLFASGDKRILEMPDHFVREMVADWLAAGRAINGSWDIREWFAKTHAKQLMGQQTKEQVVHLINLYGAGID
jgi:hypothetical protein